MRLIWPSGESRHVIAGAHPNSAWTLHGSQPFRIELSKEDLQDLLTIAPDYLLLYLANLAGALAPNCFLTKELPDK